MWPPSCLTRSSLGLPVNCMTTPILPVMPYRYKPTLPPASALRYADLPTTTFSPVCWLTSAASALTAPAWPMSASGWCRYCWAALVARSRNGSLLAVKSVLQFSSTRAAADPSATATPPTRPSVADRSASDALIPFLRNSAMAASRSPPTCVSIRLHSIIGWLVLARSSFTNLAVISGMTSPRKRVVGRGGGLEDPSRARRNGPLFNPQPDN